MDADGTQSKNGGRFALHTKYLGIIDISKETGNQIEEMGSYNN